MDDEARREQCRLRIFPTKSPTTTKATVNTIEDLSTTNSLLAVVTAAPLILEENDTDHSTRAPITPPEKYMKGVVLKIRPARPTQLANLTSATETSPTTTAAPPPNTIATKETIPASISTSTTEELTPETSAMVTTSSATQQSALTTPPTTTESTRRTTEGTVETTLRQVLLLAGSSFMNATASQRPVTATLKTSTAATTPPAAVYVESTPVTGKTTVMIAGKIPEFKRSRYYLPGTLYRPPVIQRPRTP
ncbi:hypothetical protein RvY_06084 [Ramazzottius varieornatus]|uniref:Uncharacterized protein n=1 Tax=Ramazzottius varieornatus TaxID=947166 RepID=A0A1D1UXT1_RAMVA|nr:hypothetical protein RvY_06084 [Ramazzottius varieornatus]